MIRYVPPSRLLTGLLGNRYNCCLAHDNSYSILGVDPNGGTWSGSSNSQTFTQAPESTQNISNPTNNATYSISYDMGSTGLPTPTSPTSAERAFTGWTVSLGEGATFVPASGLYTYGTGNSSLIAQYNITSNSFNLPTLSKTGYTCKWHQGSASGAEKQSNVTITGDTTFYAVCELAAPTSCAAATPVTPGQAPTTQNLPVINDTQYVKLYTNSQKTSSACFTKNSVDTSKFTTRYSGCSSKGGSGPPSQDQFNNLISAYGSDGNLNKATGWPGSYYWSSTSGYLGGNYYSYYYLSVSSSSSVNYIVSPGYSYQILCVASS